MSNRAKRRGRRVIFRAWRRTKSGRVLYARDYGHRAWPIYLK